MDNTPSWVKHFEENYKLAKTNEADFPFKDSVANSTNDAETQPRQLHHSQTYAGELSGRKLSSSQIIPRVHTAQSDLNCSVSEDEKRVKKRRRRRQIEETSGYSTTSLSEVSEVESPKRRANRRPNQNSPSRRQENLSEDGRYSAAQQRRRDNLSDDRSRVSKTSDTSKREETRRNSQTSTFSNTKRDCDRALVRNSRIRSTTDSLASAHSKTSVHDINQRRISSTSSRLDIQSLANRKLYGSRETLDPFAFIQPAPEPFGRKVRKTCRPIFGMCVMLILAASLGAAIYFAVELKKTHENEIEMLRANLALKIKSSNFDESLENLSSNDFNNIALAYCQQMDTFYKKSQFESTYRGCEVLSIKDKHINFTLFFVEKDASKRDIISVIETSAPKVNTTSSNIALVDRFEIELDEVKIKIERERTPVGFNKIQEKPTTQKPTTVKPSSSTVHSTKPTTTQPSLTNATSSTESVTNITTSSTTKKLTTTSSVNQSTESIVSVEATREMLLAWDPCSLQDGSFYRHPTDCNKYFQCEHKKSILQTCTGELVFDASSNNCVHDRPGMECPDPDKAPPKPPGYKPASPKTTTTQVTTSPSPTTTTDTVFTSNQTRSVYPGRPKYEREPCLKAKAGTLHPHPDDCKKFIQCISLNKGQELTCAMNLVYDPDAQTCIYPKNDLICPDILPCLQKSNGYFAHPFNCSLYIQCESGQEKIQTCSPGLIWVPSVNSCMYPTDSNSCKDEAS
ncbi:uncharacterized protein LOC134234145 [Saccostrea cucullata]|uniref:uncharacterized protein LOC134234145 n=1 Tax=Saccostrea cuccullata TaxID=36930 RepID=UPI002ED4B35A